MVRIILEKLAQNSECLFFVYLTLILKRFKYRVVLRTKMTRIRYDVASRNTTDGIPLYPLTPCGPVRNVDCPVRWRTEFDNSLGVECKQCINPCSPPLSPVFCFDLGSALALL